MVIRGLLIGSIVSEDSNFEADSDLENQYYNSKAIKEDSLEKALESFAKVLVHLSNMVITVPPILLLR